MPSRMMIFMGGVLRLSLAAGMIGMGVGRQATELLLRQNGRVGQYG